MLRRRELRGSTSTVRSSSASSTFFSGDGEAFAFASPGDGCSSSSSLDASGSAAPTTPTPSESTPLLARTPRLASTPSLLATTKSSSSSTRPDAPTASGCPHSSIRASLPSLAGADGGEAAGSSSSMSSMTMSPEGTAGFLTSLATTEAVAGGLLLGPFLSGAAVGLRPAALRLSSRREERKLFCTSCWEPLGFATLTADSSDTVGTFLLSATAASLTSLDATMALTDAFGRRHTKMHPSPEALTARSWSGENASPVTGSECPCTATEHAPPPARS
mmetsp:Transcript_36190/g.84768  ORF Transcript_36190/g.84768 Transcript_36190/m.84768 type:complete len:276 (+) Transcript_36190:855-1682(+)